MGMRKTAFKLTKGRAKTICDALENGHTRAAAAAAAKIARQTLHDWVRSGKQPGADPELAAFAERVEQAEGKAEHLAVSKLWEKVLAGNVYAITYWLEQRASENWRRKPEQKPPEHVDVVINIPDALKPPGNGGNNGKAEQDGVCRVARSGEARTNAH